MIVEGAASNIWHPLKHFGLVEAFWGIDLTTMGYAVIASFLLLFFAVIIRLLLDHKESLSYFVIINAADGVYGMIEETTGSVKQEVFSFVASLFCILLSYNMLVLLPFLEEPTKDLNVTLACALFAVLFIHKQGYKNDPVVYLHHWFKMPFSFKPRFITPFLSYLEIFMRIIANLVIALLLLPFELMGRCSLIFSLAFRLFGNVFGGSMISHLLKSFLEISWIYQLIGITTGLNIIVMCFFGCLEGIIQAFVFTLIIINNLGVLIASDDQEVIAITKE